MNMLGLMKMDSWEYWDEEEEKRGEGMKNEKRERRISGSAFVNDRSPFPVSDKTLKNIHQIALLTYILDERIDHTTIDEPIRTKTNPIYFKT